MALHRPYRCFNSGKLAHFSFCYMSWLFGSPFFRYTAFYLFANIDVDKYSFLMWGFDQNFQQIIYSKLDRAVYLIALKKEQCLFDKICLRYFCRVLHAKIIFYFETQITKFVCTLKIETNR